MAENPSAPVKLKDVRILLPEDTLNTLKRQAAREGISLQGLTAPVLNAFARGDIQVQVVRQSGK